MIVVVDGRRALSIREGVKREEVDLVAPLAWAAVETALGVVIVRGRFHLAGLTYDVESALGDAAELGIPVKNLGWRFGQGKGPDRLVFARLLRLHENSVEIVGWVDLDEFHREAKMQTRAGLVCAVLPTSALHDFERVRADAADSWSMVRLPSGYEIAVCGTDAGAGSAIAAGVPPGLVWRRDEILAMRSAVLEPDQIVDLVRAKEAAGGGRARWRADHQASTLFDEEPLGRWRGARPGGEVVLERDPLPPARG